MKRRTRALIRSGLLRASRTWLQSFLAVVTAAPALNLDVPTVKAAAVAGLGAVLALGQRLLDETSVPSIPPG